MPSPASSSNPDVVVVGAGLAGLTAARELVRRGRRVTVLEARDRVGGRTSSHTTPDGGVVELGAQWIGPTHHRVAALVREFGIPTFTQYTAGVKVMSMGGKVRTYKGAIPPLPPWSLLAIQLMINRLDRLSAAVPLDAPYTAAKAAEWDGMTVESWKQTSVATREARSLLDIAVRAVFAAEPAEVSFLYFLFYLHAGGGLLHMTQSEDGAQKTRFTTGTQTLAVRLAESLSGRVVLNTPVRRIVQTGDGVTVQCDAGTYQAQSVIVTVPPVLAARIEYDPPLPAPRDQWTQRVPTGSVMKCVAFYRTPFWREAGYCGEAISDTGVITATFDDAPESGTPAALLAFVNGHQARLLARRPLAERRAAVIGDFVRLFGPKAAEATDYVDKDWATDPWTRGCYVGLAPPGALTAFGEAMRAPCGRIHWAGAETAATWFGYMEGAIDSGERAAREVLGELK